MQVTRLGAPVPSPALLQREVARKRLVAQAQIEGSDSVLVFRGGVCLLEAHLKGPERPLRAMSVSKSVTGILIGRLLDEGVLDSIEQPAMNFLPEWRGDSREEITLRQLLTHTSGLSTAKLIRTHSVREGIRDSRLVCPPGARNVYNSHGVDLLGIIAQRAAGEPFAQAVERRFFQPLGIEATWLASERQPWAGGGLIISSSDLARFGQMIANGGVDRGVQRVSSSWIDQRFLWWPEGSKAFSARGWLGQKLFIAPREGVVAVAMRDRTPEAEVDRREYKNFGRDVMAFVHAQD